MEREKIELTYEQHRDICTEEYCEEFEIKVVEREYEGSSRHTEQHSLVFQRLNDNKYFRVGYETSVKDSMGWYECNDGMYHSAVEVFPEVITKTIYS